jgi:peptidoglycan/xylan/chitin deacetylase (PgdA/CDA1 family)
MEHTFATSARREGGVADTNLLWGSVGRLRRIVGWVWVYFLYWSGLIRWARRRLELSGGIVILTFHRVLEDEDATRSNSPAGMIVRRSTFENLLRFLASHYDLTTLGYAPSWRAVNNRVRVALTFDDGWKDTYDIAFPLAQKWKVPLTVFVCPGLAGKSMPFWPEHVVRAWRAGQQDPEIRKGFELVCGEAGLESAMRKSQKGNRQLEAVLLGLKRLPPHRLEKIVQKLIELTQAGLPTRENYSLDATMTLEDAARIATEGAHMGSHTQSHTILTTTSATVAQSELGESKRALEAALNRPCTLFAYPNGSWSPEVRELVVKEGFELAFVNNPGVWSTETDRWLIPRVNLWEGSLAGPRGTFSPAIFQYSAFWCSYRAEARRRKKAA